MTQTTCDRAMMARAVVLAGRGRGTTRPNPLVGCVLVRDGHLVGEGHHERAGGPHAEIRALEAAGAAASGATAYVTLEPCNHTGRTGPCAEALLAAGVERVVYALADPDPRAAGGAARLREAGVTVEVGPFADWVAVQNEAFLHTLASGRPLVTLKLAQTLDGELSVPDRRWITGEPARRAVHRRRAESDAVLVGAGTVLADDPRLDVRHVPAPGGQPRAVVLDGRGRIPVDAQVVRHGTIVVTTAAAEPEWCEALTRRGVEPVTVAAAGPGGVDLGAALAVLAERGVQSVLAEPGPTVTRALVAAGLADRLVAHVAVAVGGERGGPRLTPHASPPAGAGWDWSLESSRELGHDLELVAVRRPVRDRAGR